jgi:hypothetical protein
MGYEDSLNLYQAFNQNPVNFTDPFGLINELGTGHRQYDGTREMINLLKRGFSNPLTLKDVDIALTGISTATQWAVQRGVNIGLGLIQRAGHLINSIFIPGYGNQDHYFYYIDIHDPSGYSISVDSRPSYQKVAGYAGGDMAKLPEHLYETGKGGIKMLDPNLSSSERKQHAKRFVEGLTDAGVLVWGAYKYYKNYKAISPNYFKKAPVLNDKLNPKDINYMQSSIKNKTGDYTVLENIEGLKSGNLVPTDFPTIRIWKDVNGKIWTLDHRRLAAFKNSGVKEIPVKWVSKDVVYSELWKMTTKTEGTSIKLKLGNGKFIILE